MRPVDLRSDTVTRPTVEMRRIMAEAEVGDDVFGEDPTVNKLQHKVAELLGKEAALFVPSGTMANQVALAVHTLPGDEVYCESGCHIRNYEGGAPAALSGVMLNAIDGVRGTFTDEDVKSRLRSADSHYPIGRLIWVENSHNRAGGTIFPINVILKLRFLADRTGLKMHLDGARLWNVSVALGVKERELAAPFDSVSVCLSKGLGCPVGSLVAGSSEFIGRAHRFRKRFGGGMRQAGILAAAGLYALENHRLRLADDHRRAWAIAEAIAAMPDYYHIDLATVQTNIIIFDTTPSGISSEIIAERLRGLGVLCIPFSTKIRFVTHLEITDDDVQRTVEALKKVIKQ